MANETLVIKKDEARLTAVGKTWPDTAKDSGDGDWDDTYDGTYDGPIPRTDLPVKIVITTPPDKTEYRSGEVIDLTGIVVTAYAEDDTVWTDDDYPDGIVPLEELAFDPITANANDFLKALNKGKISVVYRNESLSQWPYYRKQGYPEWYQEYPYTPSSIALVLEHVGYNLSIYRVGADFVYGNPIVFENIEVEDVSVNPEFHSYCLFANASDGAGNYLLDSTTLETAKINVTNNVFGVRSLDSLENIAVKVEWRRPEDGEMLFAWYFITSRAEEANGGR